MPGTKFYWLRLHRDFFKRHDIQVIESMENGKDYVLFYLKLLVESIDHEGRLRFSETIPYNEQMLATVTHTNVDVVRSALKLFSELEMITVLDDQTLYMEKVSELIGQSSQDDHTRESTRKRVAKYRENQKLLECDSLQKRYSNVTCNGEIEIEKEIEIKKDILSSTVEATVAYLNEKTGSHYQSSTPKTRSLIQARLKEGFTLDDFKKVIDKKTAEWIDEPKMREYLRPITLFGTKFESYLNQQTAKPKQTGFNQMIHSEYDFDEIEKSILK